MDVAHYGYHVAKFDSCYSLLSSIHTLLINILRYVRLYIKQKYCIIIIIMTSYNTLYNHTLKYCLQKTGHQLLSLPNHNPLGWYPGLQLPTASPSEKAFM